MQTMKPIRRRRSRIINWIFLVVLLGGVIAVSVYSYRRSQKETKWRLQDYQETESVYRGDLTMSILAPATLQPFEVVEVRPEASGKVEKLYFDVGDWVNEGDILAVLDQEDLVTRLETARANLKQAEANLEQVKRGYYPRELQSLKANLEAAELALQQAKTNFDRINKLHELGFASDVELENAKNALDQAAQARDSAQSALDVLLQGSTPEQIKAAEATLEMARIAVTEAENALGDSTIYSPISGVVLERKISEGSLVVSNLASFAMGDTICSIGDLSRMKAIARVDQSDISTVKEDLTCALEVDSYPSETFTGTVLKIHPQAVLEGGVISFIVEIEVPNPDGRLMAGMTGEVEIIADTLKDVLLVPDRAIAEKEERTFVFVVDENDRIEAREITTGRTNYEYTEVLSGLKEGERVIVRGVPRDLLDEIVKGEKEESEGKRGRVVIRSDR